MLNSEDKEFLDQYFKDINRYSLLTKEEEFDLGRRISEGDKEAYDKLVTSNLRLVVYIAKKFQKNGKALTDLILEGNVGLMTAAERYDYKRGNRFSVYAGWWIRQKIMKAIGNNSRIIKFPSKENGLAIRKEYAERELSSRSNHTPTLKEVSDYLRIPHQKLSNLSLMQDVTYFSSVEEAEPNSSLLQDKRESLEEDFFQHQCREDIENVLNSVLTEKEADIIKRRNAWYGGKKESLRSIGKSYHLTKERIRQIEVIALRKLKSPNIKRTLAGYLYD